MIALAIAASLFADSIQNVLDSPELAGAWVGVCVEAPDGRTLFERNADSRLMPASNEKMLSAVYAFERLGPDWKAHTRIWKTEKGVVVEAEGDPTLELETLREAKKKLGLSGPVYVRQPYSPGIPAGWELDDLPNRYASPISAFTTGRAGFELVAENGRLVRPAPEYGLGVVRGSAKGEMKIVYDPLASTLRVSGKLPEKRTVIETLAQPNPAAAAARALGGEFRAYVGSLPSRKPDLVIESPTLAQLAKTCLENSDNILAEHLLLQAALSEGELGDDPYTVATDRLKDFLEKTVGVPVGSVRPSDGSGLSRHNLVTSRAICRILAYAQKRPYWEAFRTALAEPGEGTLRSRLAGIGFAGKTGSLDSVSALSGFLKRENGELWRVSVIINHTIAPASSIKQIENRLYEAMSRTDAFGTDIAGDKEDAHRSDLEPHGCAAGQGTGLAFGDRVFGPDGHGVLAFARHDSRVEPAHAAADRNQRVAVRVR